MSAPAVDDVVLEQIDVGEIFVCDIDGCEETAVWALLVKHWDSCDEPTWVLVCAGHYQAAMDTITELLMLVLANKTMVCDSCHRPVTPEDALLDKKPL